MDAETAAAQGGKKQIPQYRPIKSFCATWRKHLEGI
jgi:hypothetical protein